MSHTKIIVPKQFSYLGDYLKSTMRNYDLPHNAYIMKGLTGVGGTTVALQNRSKYVVAVHVKALIDAKVSQYNGYVLGVTGETTRQEVMKFINSGGKKIMVTYDSLPKLTQMLGWRAKLFRLLVDEVHKLVTYLNEFKTCVCMKVLNCAYIYKTTSFMTATTTPLEYLIPPLKNLDIVEYVWPHAVVPSMSVHNVDTNFNESLLGTVLNLLDTTTDELYIFYNSKVGVVELINNIIKAKPTLNLSDMNIMFAESVSNTTYFKKQLGGLFSYGKPPDSRNNKRINFISSMGFEGIDFYPNLNPKIKPRTLIVSNPKLKSMRYDIGVDVVQIIGRFRTHVQTKLHVQNPLHFFYTTYEYENTRDKEYSDLIEGSKDVYEQRLQHRIEEFRTYLEQAEDPKRQGLRDLLLMYVESGKTSLLYKDNESKVGVSLNIYAYEAEMSVYAATHSDYKTLHNTGRVVKKLTSIAKITEQLPPSLPSNYVVFNDKTFQNICEEYAELVSVLTKPPINWNGRSPNEAIDQFNRENNDFGHWTKAYKIEDFKNFRYDIRLLEKYYDMYMKLNDIPKMRSMLKFSPRNLYTREEAVNRLQAVYDELETKRVPTIKQLSAWYTVTTKQRKIDGILRAMYSFTSIENKKNVLKTPKPVSPKKPKFLQL